MAAAHAAMLCTELVEKEEYLWLDKLPSDANGTCLFEAQRSAGGKKFLLKQVQLGLGEVSDQAVSEAKISLKLTDRHVRRCVTSWIAGDINNENYTVKLPPYAIPGKLPKHVISNQHVEELPSGVHYLYILLEWTKHDLWTACFPTTSAACGTQLDDATKWRWTMHLAQALEYLHDTAHICHRNVSPATVYIRNSAALIGDFSAAACQGPGIYMRGKPCDDMPMHSDFFPGSLDDDDTELENLKCLGDSTETSTSAGARISRQFLSETVSKVCLVLVLRP
ncbi:hypothetical protein CYMTET_33840 [Cymbomonas tetramitiformis]|uniref:Protein kinase domain-containing protein n=1 Tax=Cymbomonas tetramitiformis TaxID=36881 RepID=A0AAE0KQS7_9CHLO|nr:hypothetical protein CYMTET_33840 [Cymbomonas tetramitiformis]